MCGLVGLPGPAALRHVVVDSKNEHAFVTVDRCHRIYATELRGSIMGKRATLNHAPEDGVRGAHTARARKNVVPEQNRGQEFALERSAPEAVEKHCPATTNRA